jgi:PEP-CTERM motif
MRYPTFLLGILLGAAAARAVPILVTLEDSGPGGAGPLAFTFDMQLQPQVPYAFADANDFSGDYLSRQADYRIHVADYFRVDMGGWIGFGYNWLLEVSPRDVGIYERYCEIRFFSSPGQTLILLGAWTSYWTEETPLSASLTTGQDVRYSDLRIADLRETAAPAVPEPASLALFGLGGLGAAAFARLRRKRTAATGPAA